MIGNVIQPNGVSGGGSGSVITEVTQAIFKSDFSVESGGTSYICNVYLSSDKETAIKQAKLVILLINKWSTDIEWFSRINISTPIIIPPNMFASAGDPSHEQLHQWGLTNGNTRFLNANFQYNPVQAAGHKMLCQMRITDTEYNSLTSNQHYSCRFQLFS